MRGYMPSLLPAAEAFVHEALLAHDGSHDYWHIARVRNMAKRIALDEGMTPDRVELVELCALLHDVDDWKYASGTAPAQRVQAFLEGQGCSAQTINDVTMIINSIGFKDQLPSTSSGSAATQGGLVKRQLSQEAQIVQDADRLDAIGAIGIARCFTFGGAFKRVLHDPSVPPRVGLTKEEYASGAGKAHNTTVNHFYEKLLLLKDLMNTDTGKRLAQERHDFMQSYLSQFHREWEGCA